MRTSAILIGVLFWLLAACRPAVPGEPAARTAAPPAVSQPISSPSLPPTPVLSPAGAFTSGASNQEPGTFLFVESWSDDKGSPACEETILIDEPTYDTDCAGGCPWQWSGGEPDRPIKALSGWVQGEIEPGGLVGFLGSGASISGIGGGVSSALYPINKLPFAIGKRATIHSVAADGSIVVQNEAITFSLQPGQSWMSRSYADEAGLETYYGRGNPVPAGCTVVETYRLTNFGLLRADQIRVGIDLASLPRETATPRPGLACTSHRPLGAAGFVWDITPDSAGGIWVAANDGAAYFDADAGRWQAFTAVEGLAIGSVRMISVGPDGTVWATGWEGKLAAYDGERWQLVEEERLLGADIGAARAAPDGALWIAAAKDLWRWDRERDDWQRHGEGNGRLPDRVHDILFTPDGTVWATHETAVSYLLPGAEHWRIHPESEQNRRNVTAGYDTAAVAPNGTIWFSGQRFYNPTTERWTETVYGGRHKRFAYDLLVDAGGGLWVARGDEQGLIYIADPRRDAAQDSWLTYDAGSGLPATDVRSLAAGAEDTIWVGSAGGWISQCRLPPAAGQ